MQDLFELEAYHTTIKKSIEQMERMLRDQIDPPARGKEILQRLYTINQKLTTAKVHVGAIGMWFLRRKIKAVLDDAKTYLAIGLSYPELIRVLKSGHGSMSMEEMQFTMNNIQ